MSREQNMIINNGVLYQVDALTDTSIDTIIASIIDDNKLGLGKDSIKFEAKPSIVDYDFAGKFDRQMKGMREICGWEVTLEGDLLDFNEKLMKVTLMETVIDTSTDYKRYKPKAKLDDDVDYSNIILVGTVKGSDNPVIILVKNCFSEEGISIELKDKDNSAVALTFKGSYEFDNADSVPFEIIYPQI